MLTWASLTVAVGCVAWAFTTGLRRGSILSPFSLTLLVLVSIFGIRPHYMHAEGEYDFYGYSIVEGLGQAAIIGFFATASLVTGFVFGSANALGRRPEIGTGHFEGANRAEESLRLSRYARISLTVLLAWLCITLWLGGGPEFVGLLFAGRSSELSQALGSVPVAVPALPVTAAAVLAFGRMTIERCRPLAGREAVWYWLLMLACIVPPSAVGTRRFLIPCIVLALTAVMQRRWNERISSGHVGIATVGFLALSIFPFVRSAGSRTGRKDLVGAMLDYFGSNGIGGTFRGFFLSYDTEMFNYVSFLAVRLGDAIPYGYGRGTLGDLLLAPLPASVTPAMRWSDQLLNYGFGASCSEGVCPVPSLVGVLYYDLAWVGVVCGMFLFGVACSRYEGALLSATGARLLTVLVLGAFAPIIVRGNSIAILWIAANVVILALLALKTAKALPPRSPSERTSDSRHGRTTPPLRRGWVD